MRVLVCGGREFKDCPLLVETLDRLLKAWGTIDAIIEGDARGADRMAGYWARSHGIDNLKYPVTDEDYRLFGRYMAPKNRNERMLREGRPDVVVAFPGDGGTADMVERARKADVFVHVVAVSSPKKLATGW